ncbi:class I SAM-dependent methyltransferase [Solirubrobacter ginsenosidimutans]|uniref:Class I SAM-dependent methyltransferase n=1 Tax=Solirubrobacter ginsenosidimutans TaxID=490573 RepID=A0A9X3MY85_9ACTN|nr:class I SAM-dependent methyltransferase [Solirubrobacter ginsenosidimutans]MDA0164742.1 class I SAM-dependent methyltransferase [Solirubrobacter ginsenosidimutans]
MRGPLARAVLAGLRATHLIGPGFRAFERWQAWRSNRGRGAATQGPDGLPLPPQRLVVLVAGPVTPEAFLAKGRVGADTVRAALSRRGVDIEGVSDILDFGVGCGRVARHWKDLDGPAVHGCDINPELVRWTGANLPFVSARVSPLAPPLPHADAAFDVVYAFSVFTHLPEDLQHAWAREMGRVLRPGGHLIISTHGTAYLDRLSPEEHAQFDAGRLVVHFEEVAGSNLCSTFHPTPFLERQFASAFTLVESVDEGAPSNGRQDLHVLQRN